MNVCVCLYLFSQQEDDHCFIIQDIEDQWREELIMQNDDHLFLQSRYLLSARGSKERLKLDCQFENKYIQSTCFAREVILLRICRSFCPEIFKLQGSSVTDQHQGRKIPYQNWLKTMLFGDWSTPGRFRKVLIKLLIFHISGEQFFLEYLVLLLSF